MVGPFYGPLLGITGERLLRVSGWR